MIPINPAFEFIRLHKPVSGEVENLVMSRTRGKITANELLQIFENGISGQYGKIYTVDAATLLKWVDDYRKSKQGKRIDTGLVNPNISMLDYGYPQSLDDWHKEINKCFTAFLNGMDVSNFHPHIYDRMLLDGKITLNSCTQHIEKGFTVNQAKHIVIKKLFDGFRSYGKTFIYFIREKDGTAN